MPEFKNKQIVLKKYATGWPDDSNFELKESVVSSENLPEGSVLIKNLLLSIDPYLRGRMKEGGSGYTGAFELNQPIQSGGIARVVASANPSYKEGDLVQGSTGWEEYTIVPASQKGRGMQKLQDKGLPMSAFVGALGMTGLTAYVGLLDIGEPKEGETVFVSAASGAVGQIVGQLAKLKGCRVVGSAGSDEKVELLKDHFGFDAAFNYKTETDIDAALKKYCPDGIDIYFDNVGGKTLEAAINNANTFARIPVCGMISQYNLEKPEPMYNIIQVLAKRLKVQGFIVGDRWASRYPSFAKEMPEWIKEGKIKFKEDITKGIENAPKTFLGMLKGENVGKTVLQLVGDDELKF